MEFGPAGVANAWAGKIETEPVKVVIEEARVEKEGLSVTASAVKASFLEDEPLVFDVTFKNVTDKAMSLSYTPEWFDRMDLRFEDDAGPWRHGASSCASVGRRAWRWARASRRRSG